MAAVSLIVCEQDGVWAAALQRALRGRIVLRETRSLTECGRELPLAGAGLVAVELTADRATRVADFLVWIRKRVVQTLPIVVAGRSLAPYEWWMREAGAAHFVTSPRQLAPLAAIVTRQSQRFPADSRDGRIEALLPWGE